MSESSVSRRLIDSISTITATNVSTVFAMYITAGPIIMRTALRSLVARDIRSPVRLRWKYAGSNCCRRAKKSLRRSNSMSREAPIMIRRCRKRNTPPTAARPSSAGRVEPHLGLRDAAVQIVDGAFQDPRTGQADGRGDENDHESGRRKKVRNWARYPTRRGGRRTSRSHSCRMGQKATSPPPRRQRSPRGPP